MSNHYETLGLQPNASKSDIRNAYFRLAHRYHPDHHAHADDAGRAAAPASFRKAKDAYDVLSDDRRRAEYDRIIRPSSSASGNRHGPYGGSASSSSTDWDSRSSSSMDYWESDLLSRLDKLRAVEEDMARAMGHGGGAYSSSSGYRNRQGQYSSSWGGYGHGGTSSSAGSGHGGGSRSRPPPRPRPQPMASGTALRLCCAMVLGGSALLWSMYKRDKSIKQGEVADKDKT